MSTVFRPGHSKTRAILANSVLKKIKQGRIYQAAVDIRECAARKTCDREKFSAAVLRVEKRLTRSSRPLSSNAVSSPAILGLDSRFRLTCRQERNRLITSSNRCRIEVEKLDRRFAELAKKAAALNSEVVRCGEIEKSGRRLKFAAIEVLSEIDLEERASNG